MEDLRKTILLVEDEAIIAMSEKNWLEDEGFNVITVPSGEIAIKTVEDSDKKIDLILMDIDLGQDSIDGIQAAGKILENHDIPLIFLSSHTEKEIIGKLEQISSYGYVLKGSEDIILLASIKMAFRLHNAYMELKRKDITLQESQKSYRELIEDEGRIARLVLQNEIAGHTRTEEKVSLLSHTLKSVTQGINITDMNNNIIFINQAFLDIYGYSEEEVINKNISMVRADKEIDYKAIKQGTVSGGWQGELLNRKKDGTIFPVFLSTSVVRNEKLEPIALVGIVTDITERRQTEQILRESEKKYRNLVDKMLDGVYKSTHDGRFLEVNPAMVKMLGYDSKEDLLTIDIKSQLYFQTTDRDSAALQEKLEEMAVFRLRKKDGSEIWVEDHGRHVTDEQGNVLYHEGIMRDVTERINSELQLQKFTAELKASNATKDKFFSILAHDLRAPFSGFMGITEDLSNNVDKLTKDEIVEYANIMHSTSQKVFELLTNLLEWSRLQTRRIDFHPQKLNLYEEVENIRNLYASAAASKSICLANNISPNVFAIADSNMISTIFRNMVSNALKFTNPGGTISIKERIQDKFIEISVTDNGIGMTDDEIDKVFRIDSGFTTKGTSGEEGTGFGLVLCKEMIEKNGGDINAISIPGKGTSFIFTLPRAI